MCKNPWLRGFSKLYGLVQISRVVRFLSLRTKWKSFISSATYEAYARLLYLVYGHHGSTIMQLQPIIFVWQVGEATATMVWYVDCCGLLCDNQQRQRKEIGRVLWQNTKRGPVGHLAWKRRNAIDWGRTSSLGSSVLGWTLQYFNVMFGVNILQGDTV